MSIGLTKLNHPTLGDVVFHRWSGHVSTEKQDLIEHHLSKQEFNWGFAKSTIDDGTNPNEFQKYDDISILGHRLIVDNKVVSDYFGALIENIGVEDLINRHHLSGEILRAQVNLFIKRDRIVNPCPHIDVRTIPHFAMLYYVNDADGDTVVYLKNPLEYKNTKEYRFTPKKGKIVYFPGHLPHEGLLTTGNKRVAVGSLQRQEVG